MKVSFIVSPGSIDINNITLYRCTKDFLHFSMDTRQKYPEFVGCGENYSTLYIGFNDGTINKNIDKGPTSIAVVGIADWFLAGQKLHAKMSHETHRYGFDICLWKVGEGKTVWEGRRRQ
jgi:hypothetical protein